MYNVQTFINEKTNTNPANMILLLFEIKSNPFLGSELNCVTDKNVKYTQLSASDDVHAWPKCISILLPKIESIYYLCFWKRFERFLDLMKNCILKQFTVEQA